MGIYDRDYYRKEGPSYLDSLIPSGLVCKWLIGINIVLFVLQLMTKPTLEEFGRNVHQEVTKVFKDRTVDADGAEGRSPMDPAEIKAIFARSMWGSVSDALQLDTARVAKGQLWRLLTYAFMHSPETWMHIFFNMLFLWWFGSEVEQLYGSKEFLIFYLVAAIAGGMAFQMQALVQGTSMVAVGASGAVTAIMVIYAFHFPHATILLFFFLPVPIWLFVIFQIGQDAFHLLGHTATSVAVSVHLGGAAFAALYYKGNWRLLGALPGAPSWPRERAKPKLRVYHPEEDLAVPVGPSGDLDEHLDAKLDAVLEKLSRAGRESLTESERQILLKASEIYKKKRT